MVSVITCLTVVRPSYYVVVVLVSGLRDGILKEGGRLDLLTVSRPVCQFVRLEPNLAVRHLDVSERLLEPLPGLRFTQMEVVVVGCGSRVRVQSYRVVVVDGLASLIRDEVP